MQAIESSSNAAASPEPASTFCSRGLLQCEVPRIRPSESRVRSGRTEDRTVRVSRIVRLCRTKLGTDAGLNNKADLINRSMESCSLAFWSASSDSTFNPPFWFPWAARRTLSVSLIPPVVVLFLINSLITASPRFSLPAAAITTASVMLLLAASPPYLIQ